MANKETLAEQTTENQALEQNQAPGFGIEKLYVKDLSLE